MAQHEGVELPIRQHQALHHTLHHHVPGAGAPVTAHIHHAHTTPTASPSPPPAYHQHQHQQQHQHQGQYQGQYQGQHQYQHQNQNQTHHRHDSPIAALASCASPTFPSLTRAISIPATTSNAAAALASAVAASYKKHKHSRSSYSESSNPTSRNNSVIFRPQKRQMPSPDKTIAVINSSGRQAASLIRVVTAVGYRVRAQLRTLDGIIATEVATNPNVTVIVGELYTRTPPSASSKPGLLHAQLTGGSESSSVSDREDVTRKGPEPISGVGVNHELISELFQGAQLAFINTTFYGDELHIGKALLDAAKAAGIEHYIYSSMPDHSAYHPDWPSLPLWAAKHEVEEYVRQSGIPATFVYTGIYNNNFTSLMYPLFCMELQDDGSFIWQAPFHPDAKLPWLDTEHDCGPAIYQIIKDGVFKWGGKRIALAYEMRTPVEVCEAFAIGLNRPVRYIRGPIDIKVKIPTGYRQQLEALEKLFTMGGDDPTKQPPYFGDAELESTCPHHAMGLWEAPRLLAEYAAEVFPVEEQANGLTWMLQNDYDGLSESGDGESDGGDSSTEPDDYDNDDTNDDGLEMKPNRQDEGVEVKPNKRDEEKWLA